MGLKKMTYEESLRDLGLLSLKKRKLKGHFIAFLNFLMGVYKEMEPDSSSRECLVIGWKTMDTSPWEITIKGKKIPL